MEEISFAKNNPSMLVSISTSPYTSPKNKVYNDLQHLYTRVYYIVYRLVDELKLTKLVNL